MDSLDISYFDIVLLALLGVGVCFYLNHKATVWLGPNDVKRLLKPVGSVVPSLPEWSF